MKLRYGLLGLRKEVGRDGGGSGERDGRHLDPREKGQGSQLLFGLECLNHKIIEYLFFVFLQSLSHTSSHSTLGHGFFFLTL